MDQWAGRVKEKQMGVGRGLAVLAGSIPRGEASRLRSGDFRSAVLHVAIKLGVTSAESASGAAGTLTTSPEENSAKKAFR